MANTIEIAVTDTAWTVVANGVASGFLTNEGIQKLKYRESNVLPVDEIGHTLEMPVGAFVAFSLVAGQNVYIKSVDGDSKVAITLE